MSTRARRLRPRPPTSAAQSCLHYASSPSRPAPSGATADCPPNAIARCCSLRRSTRPVVNVTSRGQIVAGLRAQNRASRWQQWRTLTLVTSPPRPPPPPSNLRLLTVLSLCLDTPRPLARPRCRHTALCFSRVPTAFSNPGSPDRPPSARGCAVLLQKFAALTLGLPALPAGSASLSAQQPAHHSPPALRPLAVPSTADYRCQHNTPAFLPLRLRLEGSQESRDSCQPAVLVDVAS